jgi:CheY-like chemotaxis protein
MPGLDGASATLVLKSDPRSKHIPVVAITCHDLTDFSDAARQTPFDAIIHKPCLPEDVAALVIRLLRQRESAK